MAYYGCDEGTTTNPCVPAGTNNPQFYGGDIGSGNSQTGPTDFDTTAATNAGECQTYAFWNVYGPDQDPNWNNGYGPSGSGYTPTDAQAWGTSQAQQAVTAWSSNPYGPYVGNRIIFADIETDNPGWLSPSTNYPGGPGSDINFGVYEGFCNYLNSTSLGDTCGTGTGNAGVYSSNGEWGNIFGSASITSSPANYKWVADWVGTGCNPGSGPSLNFGGSTVWNIWQYWGSDTADYDYAVSLP